VTQFQTFHLIPAKKEKFVTLVKKLLSSPSLTLLEIQKLAGKCCSMSMAVPGARLFTNELNIAISKACRSSRPTVMTTPLREEIKHWLFIPIIYRLGLVFLTPMKFPSRLLISGQTPFCPLTSPSKRPWPWPTRSRLFQTPLDIRELMCL
jgi:hypothetical protein